MMPEGAIPGQDPYWPVFYYPDNDPNSPWNHKDEVLNGVFQEIVEIPVVTALQN